MNGDELFPTAFGILFCGLAMHVIDALIKLGVIGSPIDAGLLGTAFSIMGIAVAVICIKVADN